MDLGKFVSRWDSNIDTDFHSVYTNSHVNNHAHAYCRSPNSDLDMCLQVPPDSATNITGEDMAKLADKLAEVGMIDVDTSRLTARIPVVKFNCRVEIGGSESIIECDISMQNPLACINTTLLQSYSTITPRVRILAAMIKRWAKRRDINDPSCVSAPFESVMYQNIE